MPILRHGLRPQLGHPTEERVARRRVHAGSFQVRRHALAGSGGKRAGTIFIVVVIVVVVARILVGGVAIAAKGGRCRHR